MAEYDQITRDLARKAGGDVTAAIYRVIALHDDPDAKTMIALMAAGNAMAIPAAFLAVKLGANPEVVADALWSKIRPIVIAGMKEVEAHHGLR